MADNREASLFHINDYNSGSSINKNQAIQKICFMCTLRYITFLLWEK
jgi:hypothetical protein